MILLLSVLPVLLLIIAFYHRSLDNKKADIEITIIQAQSEKEIQSLKQLLIRYENYINGTQIIAKIISVLLAIFGMIWIFYFVYSLSKLTM